MSVNITVLQRTIIYESNPVDPLGRGGLRKNIFRSVRTLKMRRRSGSRLIWVLFGLMGSTVLEGVIFSVVSGAQGRSIRGGNFVANAFNIRNYIYVHLQLNIHIYKFI